MEADVLSLVIAEQWLEYAQVVVELTSLLWKLVMPITQLRQREEDGLELEVSLWIPSIIPMVVVINNILVIHLPSVDMHLLVKKSDLLPLEELVLLEEEEKILKKKNYEHSI